MKLIYSKHWALKRGYRSDIIDELIIYAIQNSRELRDENWSDALNAITKVPPAEGYLKLYIKSWKIKLK